MPKMFRSLIATIIVQENLVSAVFQYDILITYVSMDFTFSRKSWRKFTQCYQLLSETCRDFGIVDSLEMFSARLLGCVLSLLCVARWSRQTHENSLFVRVYWISITSNICQNYIVNIWGFLEGYFLGSGISPWYSAGIGETSISLSGGLRWGSRTVKHTRKTSNIQSICT